MSRVFLLSSNISTDPYPVYPLGMAIVAGALQQAGHTVQQFDFLVNSSWRHFNRTMSVCRCAISTTSIRSAPMTTGIWPMRNAWWKRSKSSVRCRWWWVARHSRLCPKRSGITFRPTTVLSVKVNRPLYSWLRPLTPEKRNRLSAVELHRWPASRWVVRCWCLNMSIIISTTVD